MKNIHTLIIINFLFISCWFSRSNYAQTPSVQTQYGTVTGQMNGTVYEFLGIPFAAPPVDSLRWMPTVEHQGWSSPLPCNAFPPKCPQKSIAQMDTTYTIDGDEDCLFLNVWSPDTSDNLPVMVFIHGGGHQAGSASEFTGGTYIYHGKNMAERGHIVVVTIQYRLGALGYLVHPGLEQENPNGKSGNYGTMDQIFALQWVQSNISGFGGDPSNVTIFGESAGGTAVGNLMLTPQSNGLFHKAIIQSAAPNLDLYNEARINGISFVDQFFPTGTPEQKIDSMRSLHADSISEKLESPLSAGIIQGKWKPVIDQMMFFGNPLTVFQSGNYNNVPLIIGSNSEEMSLSAPQIVTPMMMQGLINTYIPVNLRPQAEQLYPPGTTNQQARESYIYFLSDAQFTATARRTAQCVSLNQYEPVWRYFFTFRHTLPILEPYGAYHGMELFYVFNNWETATLGSGILFKPADDSVQTHMLAYWTNFARTGNPNGTNLVNWPVFDAQDDCYLEIKATPIGTQCGLLTAKSDFWDQVVNFSGCSSSINELQNHDIHHHFEVYPNPAKDIFYIHQSTDTEFVLNIFDMSGKLIQTYHKPDVLNISDLSEGMYVVRIVSTDMQLLYNVKLIKM